MAAAMPAVVTIDICVGSMAIAERGRISPSGRPGVVLTVPHRKHRIRIARKLAGR
jgi:hypothetical protein